MPRPNSGPPTRVRDTEAPATATPACAPQLDGRFAVMLRSDDTVQIGTSSDRAVVVRPPQGVRASQLADVLRHLDGSHQLSRALRRAHLTIDRVRPVLDELTQAGLLSPRPVRMRSGDTVTVVGPGPLAERLRDHLPGIGVRVGRPGTSDHTELLDLASPALVVLADHMVIEPRLLRTLHERRLPHLHVHLRDGTGVVGPLVVPGRTACLRCGDLFRRDRDPAWPDLMLQQLGRNGFGDAPTVVATAGLALSRVRSYVRRGEVAPGLDTMVELDLHVPSLRAHAWPEHPGCHCVDERSRLSTTAVPGRGSDQGGIDRGNREQWSRV